MQREQLKPRGTRLCLEDRSSMLDGGVVAKLAGVSCHYVLSDLIHQVDLLKFTIGHISKIACTFMLQILR